jgi:hypothetical protein
VHFKNKFLQDYAKPNQHGSPKDEKDKKNKVRQYNNPKTALQSERKGFNV